jgi:predicted NBD/HSP70 family sugar kinase
MRRIDAERHSLSVILNLIRSHADYTRQDLEHISGLGRAVVVDRLSTLSRLGLADEDTLGRPTGGRAPRLVRFRADAGLLLVAILDQHSIGVGLADLSGTLLSEHHESADLSEGPEPTLKRLFSLFDWVLEQHQPVRPVWGIGLAVSGPVEPEGRGNDAGARLHFLPSWNDYPLEQKLVRQYGAPVAIRTSTQMRALGELRAGGGGGNSLLFVEVAQEVSAAIISNGHLLRGAQGASGLIGHIPSGDDNHLVCRCGSTGCLETVAGVDAITRLAREAAQSGDSRPLAEIFNAAGEITPEDIGLAALRGDPFSAKLLARCGRQVGTVLASLVNAINPPLIVLSGPVAMTGDIFLASVREAIYSRAHPLVSRDLRIVRSQMGSSAALAGAAFTIMDEIFEPNFLGGWITSGTPQHHSKIAALAAQDAGPRTASGRTARAGYAESKERRARPATGRQR